jgi:hypothetical protein
MAEEGPTRRRSRRLVADRIFPSCWRYLAEAP